MARELQIKVWCDLCRAEDIQTDAEELPPIAIAGAKPKVLALCKEHRETHYEPFAAMVSAYGETLSNLLKGKPVKRPSGATVGDSAPPSQASDSSTGKYVQCPECDESRKNPAGISKHLRTAHGKSLFDAIGAGGTLYDIDGTPVDTPKARARKLSG
jgi:hypothetical protein